MSGQGRQDSRHLTWKERSLTQNYFIIGDLGEGGFGEVKLAVHRLTGTEVAVKVGKGGRASSSFIMNELDIMKEVQHPHVIQLFQVIQTSENIYIVMEHASGGDLQQRLPMAGMREEEARKVFRQIACAVRYCHEKGIAHRDLKPRNIMLDAQGRVKIIDFGLGCRFRPGEKLHRVCGTFPYWAPEVCGGKKYDGPAADIWSLGVILHLMVTGYFPIQESTPVTQKQILRARDGFPTHLSRDVHSLIFQLLTLNPMQRPTLDRILGHPWLMQGEEFSPRPSSEPLSNHVNPTVLMAMVDIGFNLHQTWLSLKHQKYDDEMAAYLMLQNQLSQGTGGTLHVNPMFGKVMGHLSSKNLPPRRRASEPALGAVPSLPFEQIEEDKHSWLKGGRGNSLSALPLFSRMLGTHPISVPWPDGPVVPPLSPSNVGEPEDTRSSQELSPQDPHSSSSSGSPRAGTAASALGGHNQGWKGVARRMARWFLKNCCCCCRAPRTGPAFNSQVHPA